MMVFVSGVQTLKHLLSTQSVVCRGVQKRVRITPAEKRLGQLSREGIVVTSLRAVEQVPDCFTLEHPIFAREGVRRSKREVL